MRRYLRLGLPSGLESFMNIATFNLFLLLFQSYGVVQGAAMAIVFNWDFLSFIPMIGLNIGVMSLIGRFVGARRYGAREPGDLLRVYHRLQLLGLAGGYLPGVSGAAGRCVRHQRRDFQ